MMNTRAKRWWLLMFVFFIPLSAGAVEADIVLSEIGAFEKNGEEWVELYNRADQAVAIEGWKFVEDFSSKNPKGVAHKLRAFQGDFVLEPHEYALIAQDAALFHANHYDFLGTIIDSSWSSLKQAGERLELKDKNGVVVESFLYPLSSSKTSLQRISMEKSGGDQSNWQSHPVTHSAGAPNVFRAGVSASQKPQNARTIPVPKKEQTQDAQKLDMHIEKQRSVMLPSVLSKEKPAVPKGPWDKIVYQAMPSALLARDERTPLLKKLGASLAITLLLLAISWRKRGKQRYF